MSDFWYRDPLPPYEDPMGNLWTLDGECLNPKLGPEPHADLEHFDLQVEIAMAFAGDPDSPYFDYGSGSSASSRSRAVGSGPERPCPPANAAQHALGQRTARPS